VGFGQVMSAATIIMQAADKRVLSKNVRVMIHAGTSSMNSVHPKIHEAWVKQFVKDEKVIENLYMDRIKQRNPEFTLKKLRKLLTFDTILSCEETIEMGLADEIL